jgi:hypothetical protein
LRGKSVAIIADADEPGRKHAEQVAVSLWLRAASTKVIELPGAKDLSEWIEKGGTREALLALIDGAPEWKPQGAAAKPNKVVVRVYDCSSFLQEKFADASDHLVGRLIRRGGATLLFGLPKGLKSWFALSIGLDASCGRSVLGMFSVAAPVKTLLVQVEDPPSELQKRVALLIRSNGAQGPAPGMFRIICYLVSTPYAPLNLGVVLARGCLL